MPYDRLPTRVRYAVRDAIRALNDAGSLPGGFTDETIVARSTPTATGLASPAIVVSPGKARRRAGFAGLRLRRLAVVVSVYVANPGDGTVDDDLVEAINEAIAAAFDLPISLPSDLAAIVEVEESRVEDGVDAWLPAEWRYYVAASRMIVVVETCQTSGAVT